MFDHVDNRRLSLRSRDADHDELSSRKSVPDIREDGIGEMPEIVLEKLDHKVIIRNKRK